MIGDQVAVLEIGSRAVTLVFKGHKDKSVISKSEVYGGFYDGDFIDNSLPSAIESVFENLRESLKTRDILVGVPEEFTAVALKRVNVNFKEAKPITEKDLDSLAEKGASSYGGREDYEIISASDISYIADGVKYTKAPLGIKAKSLIADISYVFIEKQLTEILSAVAERLKVSFVYTSGILALATFVVPEELRDGGGVFLFDTGFTSSSVALVRGDGIVYQKSFLFGSMSIAEDLVVCMEHLGYSMPDEDAMDLLPKINLNWQPREDEAYPATRSKGAKPTLYPACEINEIARARVEVIAETAKTAIDTCPHGSGVSAEILLTGMGLGKMQGAKEIIQEITGKKTTVLKADGVLQFSDPAKATIAALILMQQKRVSKVGFIKKLINKLFK